MTKTDVELSGVAIRCGDHVKHGPTGETWTVAYVEGNYLAYCGWPEGEARLADCTLVYRCIDEEHQELLERCAKLPLPDARGRKARALLSRLNGESHG